MAPILQFLLFFSFTLAAISDHPVIYNAHSLNITYRGILVDGVEGFVGIRYAHETSGQNRFKPPIPFVPTAGSTVNADLPGPACPQYVGHLRRLSACRALPRSLKIVCD